MKYKVSVEPPGFNGKGRDANQTLINFKFLPGVFFKTLGRAKEQLWQIKTNFMQCATV